MEEEEDLQLPSTAPWPVHDNQNILSYVLAERRADQHSLPPNDAPAKISDGRHNHLIRASGPLSLQKIVSTVELLDI